MKDERIVEAFDRAAPSEAQAKRMLGVIEEKANLAAEVRRPVRVSFRRVALIAACVAVVAALGVTGYATYKRWSLPAPTEISSGGRVVEHGNTEYSAPSPDGDYPPLSDEDFMLRAQEVLRVAGIENVAPEKLTVVEQEDLYWDRREVVVAFDLDGDAVNVRFDAESGAFLGLFDKPRYPDGREGSPVEAEIAAANYYSKLPVPQDYVLTGTDRIDERCVMCDFRREVLPGVFSDYEAIRIAVDPQNGSLLGCTRFYVPLLDDHAEGEEPLTVEEADALARASGALKGEGWELRSSDIAVGLPNWMFSDGGSVDHQASKVTRLCREMVYERKGAEFDASVKVMVDLYTGEILGGDMTK
ncbi:MAG: hypothetical protein J5756_02675 [Clostridia bacterium]|nr:hypothetical protein [Clostridia bacterium]